MKESTNSNGSLSDKTTICKLENYLLEHYQFRYNEVTKETEFKPNQSQTPFSGIDDRQIANIRIELSKRELKGFKALLDDLLKSSSFAPSFHPFEDYFKGLLQWKKGDENHIAKLCSYIKVKEQAWFNRMFEKHLIRTVACALRKLPFNKHCFVLQGKQNDGKSSLVRFLTPAKLKDYYKENPPLDHKDSMLALGQNFLINLDELHDLNKTDANKVKSLFSLTDTKVRGHYATKDTLQPRYASFFGTINEREFLNDVTGNVRWLIFEIIEVLHDLGGVNGYAKNIDIDLVWAQAYGLLLAGESYQLTNDEIGQVERLNRAYQKTTPEIDLIAQYFRKSTLKASHSFAVTATDIMQSLQEITKNQVRLNHIQIGKAMSFLGFPKESVRLPFQDSPTYRYIVTSSNLDILNFLENHVSSLATSELIA